MLPAYGSRLSSAASQTQVAAVKQSFFESWRHSVPVFRDFWNCKTYRYLLVPMTHGIRSNMDVRSLQWTNLLEESLPLGESEANTTSSMGIMRVKLDMRCFEIKTLQITLVPS
jgi:hypothetical protein